MAFDFVFAVFPGILVISTLVAILEIPENALGKLMVDLGVVVPLPVVAIVEENLRHLARSSDRLFFLGVIGIVWPASASMSTTMSALNRAYGVEEGRSFWLRRGLSLVLVVSLVKCKSLSRKIPRSIRWKLLPGSNPSGKTNSIWVVLLISRRRIIQPKISFGRRSVKC